MSRKPGYHGVILNIDLSTGKSEKVAVPPEDLDKPGRFRGSRAVFGAPGPLLVQDLCGDEISHNVSG